MQRKKTDPILYILSFFVTAIILFIAFALNGIYPSSEKSIFIYDMGAQYASFFSYLHHLGEGYNTVFYQTLSALGGDYYGTWAYYTASPLSLFVLLFDPSELQEAIYYLTLIKVSLSAVSFSVFVRHGRLKELGFVPTLAGAAAYSLMSYNIVYSMSLMWIDGVILLPLVILGVEKVFFENRRVLFCISLALALMFNYYTGYMIVLFVVIYFLYLCIYSGADRKQVLAVGIRLLISGLISVLMSSVVWLPVALDLTGGRLNEEANVMFGFMRNPFGVIRQLLPFSYGGFSADGNPPVYCGIMVSALAVFYFAGRKISKRKKLAAVFVFVIFIVSFCLDGADLLWHGMQFPVSFPARYSFLFSFFLITVFLEAAHYIITGYDTAKTGPLVLCCIFLFILADLGFNSYYLIRSLDNDPDTGGYLKSVRYEHYYGIYDELTGYFTDANTRIVSDLDCSSDDGLMFGISSLDYFSSSYNNELSVFYKSLGLNTMRHNFEDVGLNPLSASLLGVDHYVPFLSDFSDEEYRPDLADHFIRKELPNGFGIYENTYSSPLIVSACDEDSADFSANAFENLNSYCRDITGVDNVFVRCEEENVIVEPLDDGRLVKRTFTVHPLNGSHLYFYVSPEDYETGDGVCYDYLFLGDTLIASYENYGYRYIVDLGVSDGSELGFSFVSYSGNSDVWLYSFDDVAYLKAMETLDNVSCNTVYGSEGIESDITADKETDLVVLLPYKKGYKITVDGNEADYGSYRDSLIKLHVTEGEHHISVRYSSPGFIAGAVISLFSFALFALSIIFPSLRRRRSDNGFKNEDRKTAK